MRAAERASGPPALSLLRRGEVRVLGRLPWSSNHGVLVTVGDGAEELGAVYKPLRGERPLWDYPPGLHRREAAVYAVSAALGWDLVPETVVRDGPFGPGSFQRFVPAELSEHYYTLLERPEHHPRLLALAVLDVVVNSGDRKAGHCLLGTDGRVWAIDNGLSLHAEPKLRTVIWDFGGRPVPEALVADVARLAGGLPPSLEGLLEPRERQALTDRAGALAARPVLPRLRSPRDWPWPLV